MEGVDLKLWNFSDVNAGWPMLWRYRQERDGVVSAAQVEAVNRDRRGENTGIFAPFRGSSDRARKTPPAEQGRAAPPKSPSQVRTAEADKPRDIPSASAGPAMGPSLSPAAPTASAVKGD